MYLTDTTITEVVKKNKLKLPVPVTKGVIGKLIKYTYNDKYNAAEFTFDVDGIELRKLVNDPSGIPNKTEEKLAEIKMNVANELNKLANSLGIVKEKKTVNTFKEFCDLLFTDCTGELRLKIVYNKNVVPVENPDTANKELFTPFTQIAKWGWWKSKLDISDFYINPKYDIIDYELIQKITLEPDNIELPNVVDNKIDELPF